MSQNVTLVVRDSVAAANERDLPKYLDAAKVRTMTVGRSAERGKPLLRQGQTRERGTRKAKIEGLRPTAAVCQLDTLDGKSPRLSAPRPWEGRGKIPDQRLENVKLHALGDLYLDILSVFPWFSAANVTSPRASARLQKTFCRKPSVC